MTTKQKLPSEPDSERYRLLFEAAPDAILVVDGSGRVLMNNAQAEKLLEASSGELIGMSVEKFVPLSSRKRHLDLRAGFIRTVNSRPMGAGLSLHAVRLDGREFPVEISLSSTDGVQGKEIIVVMRDVTERLNARRAQDELIRSNALTRVTQIALRERDFQAMCDQLTQLLIDPLKADLIAVMYRPTEGGNFILQSAYGDAAESMLDTHSDSIPSAVEQRTPILVGDANASGNFVFPFSKASGFLSFVSVPLFDNDVAIGTIIAACRQPHRFGTEDVAFFEAVTNIVATALQRSAAQNKLIKSQRLESLGQLTGGVAHDFNNLLTVISGNLQLLEWDVDKKPGNVRAIAAAQRAAIRGAELTAKLLAFARRQTLRPEPIDVSALLRGFQEMLSRILGESIKIETQIASDLPNVLADIGAIEDTLLNLAVNARDAMPQGGTLTISADSYVVSESDSSRSVHELIPGHYVTIDISDTGLGMTPETMSNAFEPFFTTKPVGKGSGLGLSMVYGFVKQSAGHVSLRSVLGLGTSVTLYLPATSELPGKKPATKATGTQEGTSEKILVVEDDIDVVDIATVFLESLGYLAISASNLRSAVTELERHPDISLLFSDVMLSENENGPQVFKALSAIKPTLRVLYTSGYARDALSQQIGLDQRLDFLKKPYSREELSHAVQGALLRPTPP
jgi:PAS domain S-box-containing protein